MGLVARPVALPDLRGYDLGPPLLPRGHLQGLRLAGPEVARRVTAFRRDRRAAGHTFARSLPARGMSLQPPDPNLDKRLHRRLVRARRASLPFTRMRENLRLQEGGR